MLKYKLDKDEKIRTYFIRQIVKVQRVAGIGSLVLLTINLSLAAYPYVAWRGVNPYFGIICIFMFVIFMVCFLAHIWMNWLEMYRGEAATKVSYNPYQVYTLSPYEEMWFRLWFIPVMEHMIDGDKEKLSSNLVKVKEWVEKGYIPKKQFPEHLLKYYITKKEGRL